MTHFEKIDTHSLTQMSSMFLQQEMFESDTPAAQNQANTQDLNQFDNSMPN